MATRKRTAGGPPPEEPRLQVARAEARRSLDERIEIGQQMLDRPVNSAQGIDELKNDFRTWHDYNERLLQRLFTTTALADEYMPVMFMSSIKERFLSRGAGWFSRLVCGPEGRWLLSGGRGELSSA
jgi:hypothetical protein